jgi:hypothetical protein
MALEILQILQIIGAMLLMFFLPGFMLVQALFPRKKELDEEYDLLLRIVLGVGMSIVITALDGFVLGSLGVNPDTDKGYWEPFYITLSLASITVILFAIGLYRGGYPFLFVPKKQSDSKLKFVEKDSEDYIKIMDQLKTHRNEIEKIIHKLENIPLEERKKYEIEKNNLEKKVKKLEDELIELGKSEVVSDSDEYD